jgi:hypothetical protein
MRRMVLFAALLLTTTQTFAQELVIRPKFRAGDEFRLELTRTRENSARPQQNGESRTLVDVRIISATPQGFVLDWIPGETVIDNPRAAQDPLITAASDAVRGLRFRIRLSAEGTFAGLANQPEVAPRLQAMLDTITQQLSARLPAQQRPSFQNLIAQVLSPSAVIASATREVEIYFGLHGTTLALGKTAETNLRLPGPLGTGEIPAKFKVQLESLKPDSASLKTKTTYDAAALSGMTESFVRQTGVANPAGQGVKFPPMQMEDDGTYLFDPRVGLMREMTVNRRLSVANIRRSDTWRLRLIN